MGATTSIIIADSPLETRLSKGVRTYLFEQGVKSVLVIPLSSKGQVNGMFSFRFRNEPPFQEEELEIARALATQASLAIQLTQLARTARESSNIPGLISCSFRASRVDEQALSPQVQQDLLRIGQEAIRNALRHARPSQIKVSLRGNQSNLLLRVTDNGSGLDSMQPVSEGHGFGFANMSARAKNLGAALDIESKPGHGTSVIVRLRLADLPEARPHPPLTSRVERLSRTVSNA
jgi:LytS/YehU family sensor histidine kinase